MKTKIISPTKEKNGKFTGAGPLEEHILGKATAALIDMAKVGDTDYLKAVKLIKQGADLQGKDGGKTAADHYSEFCQKHPDHELNDYPNGAIFAEVLKKGNIFEDPDFNPAVFA